MKSIELGTFALVVLFIGGMTMKHNDQVRADQQAAETLEQVRMKQESFGVSAKGYFSHFEVFFRSVFQSRLCSQL